jgi:hypothetical protein
MEPSFPKWTKIIDLSKELHVRDFPLHEAFRPVANIVADESTTRQTVIEFVPTIPVEEWKKKAENIYFFTIDDKIVKIGGTRTGLKDRTQSYLCGHHIPERGKSRDCSKTNGYIYNTFDHYIRNGHAVKMWAYEIPPAVVKMNVWGKEVLVAAQTYTAFETQALELYKTTAGHYPALSDNSDPSHRSM